MKRLQKTVLSVLIAVLMICVLPAAAFAHPAFDHDAVGSITVEMKYLGIPVSGGVMSAWRVADVADDDGSYSYVLTAEFAGLGEPLDNVGSAQLADKAAEYALQNSIGPVAEAKNVNGYAVFGELRPGLYLIMQTTASRGFDKIAPFMVSVPQYDAEKDDYVYDVSAYGKFQLHIATPTPLPSVPPKPPLPQTGQINWPVPVLTLCGLALFALGWKLRFGKRSDDAR